MIDALVIVWRESMEALLVLGVLAAWVARCRPAARLFLWGGVLGGLLLAGALALLMQGVFVAIPSEWQEPAQILLLLLAAVLMTYMVVWMHRQARGLSRDIAAALDSASARRGNAGVAWVAALAVAREGAETVLFLQGIAHSQHGTGMALGALVGLCLAGACTWAMAKGLRFLPPREVFRVSALMLLLFAGGLVLNGADRMIGLEWLPPGADPLWDSQRWLDDASGGGKWLADLFGYRARPSATVVGVLVAYWFGVLMSLNWSRLKRLGQQEGAA